MIVADTCASLVALPIAWALIALKHAIPAAPERRYRCTLARLVNPPNHPPEEAERDFELALAPTADVFRFPTADISHELHIH